MVNNRHNYVNLYPSIDAIQEFKVQTGNYSAEYGGNAGSNVNIQIKSGANDFHGDVFEFIRNDAVDARNYFIPAPIKKNILKQNQFGGTVGGPIVKNKTFFFFSYEGLRQHQGILQNSPVFSQAQQDAYAANAANDPIAAAFAALIPLPNSGPNFVSFTPGPVQIDQYTGDVLQQLGPNDSLHGFYAFQKDVRTEPALQGDTLPGWGDHRAAHRQIGTLQYVHIFNSNVTNEARLGFNRISIAFHPANLIDPASIGIVDGLTGNVGIPQTTITDVGFTVGGPSGFPQGRNTTTGVLSDTVTMLKGKNQIKWGGEFRRYLYYSFAGNIDAT